MCGPVWPGGFPLPGTHLEHDSDGDTMVDDDDDDDAAKGDDDDDIIDMGDIIDIMGDVIVDMGRVVTTGRPQLLAS